MTDQLAAHLRLLEQLAPRTRTHRFEAATKERGLKYTADEKDALRKRLLALEANGMNRKQMVQETGTSHKTIVKLIGPSR